MKTQKPIRFDVTEKKTTPARHEDESEDDYQLRCQIYDRFLVAVPDPALVRFGARCVIGAWVSVGHASTSAQPGDCGFVMRSTTRAVRVFGEGWTWEDAEAKAWAWLEGIWARSGHADPRKGLPGPSATETPKGKPQGMPPL